jgi:hypothetical protein
MSSEPDSTSDDGPDSDAPAAPDQAARIVVVQAEELQAKASPEAFAPNGRDHVEARLPWIPVGALLWVSPGGRSVTFVVKTTFTWAGAARDASGKAIARLADEQEPLRHPREGAGAEPGERQHASDWAPAKKGADVLIVGHARSAQPVTQIRGHLAAAGVFRPFLAVASAPAQRLPLTKPYVRGSDGSPTDPLGPIEAPGHDGAVYPEDFDFSRYNEASPLQRAASIEPDLTIELAGVLGDGERTVIELPGLVPLVTLDGIEGYEEVECPLVLVCDTVWIDVDRELVALTWRAAIPVDDDGSELDRVVLSLWDFREPIDFEARRTALMRGSFGFTLRPLDDPEAHGAINDEEDGELTMARYATWEAEAPSPRIPIEQFAIVSAELAEWPDKKHDTYRRAGLDEHRWSVEERAWLELMGKRAMDGDTGVAERYSELYASAQASFVTEAELSQTLDEYAEIHASVNAAEDVSRVFAAYKITLAQWLRMELRWRERARDDAALDAEIQRRIAEAKPIVLPDEKEPAIEAEETVAGG